MIDLQIWASNVLTLKQNKNAIKVMDARMNEWKKEWLSERMNEWLNEWMDEEKLTNWLVL